MSLKISKSLYLFINYNSNYVYNNRFYGEKQFNSCMQSRFNPRKAKINKRCEAGKNGEILLAGITEAIDITFGQ